MIRCPHDDCGWRAVAPSRDAATQQFAEHVVAEHAREVDADVPEGMVQVKVEREGEWLTMTPTEARALHDRGDAEPHSDDG